MVKQKTKRILPKRMESNRNDIVISIGGEGLLYDAFSSKNVDWQAPS